jgi:hypothetical protein
MLKVLSRVLVAYQAVLDWQAQKEQAPMKFELVDEAKAPGPVKKPTTARMRVSHEIVSSLVPGKVARVRLEPADSMRGTKASLTRAADRLDRSVEVWDRDGDIYVKLQDKS